jgi:hypothetical protein
MRHSPGGSFGAKSAVAVDTACALASLLIAVPLIKTANETKLVKRRAAGREAAGIGDP